MIPLIWPLIALVVGLALVVAEVFLPTGGLVGLGAAGALAFALAWAYGESPGLGHRFLVAEGVLVPSAFGVALHLMPRTRLGRRAFLRPPGPDELGVSHDRPDLGGLVGHRGRALTPLRPSGMVEFAGRRLDGASDGGMIDPGSPVVAVAVRSGRLIVRAL